MSAKTDVAGLLDESVQNAGLVDAWRSGSLSSADRRKILHELRLVGIERFRAEGEWLRNQLDTAAMSAHATFGLTDVLRGFKGRAVDLLGRLFAAGWQALFGSETEKEPPATDQTVLGEQLRRQIEFFDGFLADIESGNQPVDGTLISRAGQYGASVWGALQAVDRSRALRAGFEQGMRVHGGADAPCSDCSEEIARGWQPIDELLPIGDSQCRGHCHCYLVYRTTTAFSGATAPMSKLNTKQRKELPESDFGDPGKRLFPIVDQDDVESAAHLIGKAGNPEAVKKRIIAIAKRKGLSLPTAWKADDPDRPKAAMSASEPTNGKRAPRVDVVAFDLDKGNADGEMVVYKDALLFRAGEYPDKDFSMSPEELWAASAQLTAPVPNELDHVNSLFGTSTILDGKLGEVRETHVSGDELRGTVAIPKWLDKLWEGPKKVSCAWNRATKTLDALGLVLKGHVPDAQLVAAFAAAYPDHASAAFAGAHRTPEGSSHLQQIHDHAAMAGAVCDPDNSGNARRAMFVSARERTGIQKIHDAAVEHGASCRVMSGRTGFTKVQEPRRMSAIERVKRALFGAKAAEIEATPEMTEDEAKVFLAAMAGGTDMSAANANGAAANGKPAPEAAATFADHPQFKSMQAELNALREKNLRGEATTWADGLVREGRATPAQRTTLIAAFMQLSTDDAERKSVVTFSDGQKDVTGGRLDALKALFAVMPTESERFAAFVKGAPVTAMDSVARSENPDDRPPDPKNVAKLMKLAGVIEDD